jgi:hypothetical protein
MATSALDAQADKSDQRNEKEKHRQRARGEEHLEHTPGCKNHG